MENYNRLGHTSPVTAAPGQLPTGTSMVDVVLATAKSAGKTAAADKIALLGSQIGRKVLVKFGAPEAFINSKGGQEVAHALGTWGAYWAVSNTELGANFKYAGIVREGAQRAGEQQMVRVAEELIELLPEIKSLMQGLDLFGAPAAE